MKITVTLLFAAAFSLFGVSPVRAQSASDALVALQKLQTRCETGISYRDYSSALADAKFPVRQFIESENAASHPELVAVFSKAVEHYEFAGALWNAKFSAPRDDRMLSGGFIYHKGPLGTNIKSAYPDAFMMKNYFPVDAMLPFLWSKASGELAEAKKLLDDVEPNEAETLRAENERLRAEVELEELRRENEALKKQVGEQKSQE